MQDNHWGKTMENMNETAVPAPQEKNVSAVVSEQKRWGLFASDGSPVATGDSWHTWRCPQQQFEDKGYDHPITGEWVNDGLAALPCPFEKAGIKLDICSRCGMKFVYP